MQVGGWAQTAGREGCVKSHPTPLLYQQTVQPATSCYSNYGIMARLDIAAGAVFTFDAFSVCNNFFSFCISHRYTRISLLFQYTTLYITHPLFLSCFSTQHCISPTLYFSPVSVHNTVYLHSAEFCVVLNRQLLEFLLLLFAVASIFCNQASSTLVTFLYTQDTCVTDLPSIEQFSFVVQEDHSIFQNTNLMHNSSNLQ